MDFPEKLAMGNTLAYSVDDEGKRFYDIDFGWFIRPAPSAVCHTPELSATPFTTETTPRRPGANVIKLFTDVIYKSS